jgi:hypothetical protein
LTRVDPELRRALNSLRECVAESTHLLLSPAVGRTYLLFRMECARGKPNQVPKLMRRLLQFDEMRQLGAKFEEVPWDSIASCFESGLHSLVG